MRYIALAVLALLLSLGAAANATSVADGFEGLPATYNLYMDPTCTAEITPAARLSGANGLRLVLDDSDNYARVKIDVSSLNLKLKDIYTASSWIKRVVGDANLPYFMFDVATPDPGSLVIQFSDITAPNDTWTEKVMTSSSLVHVPQGRYNLLPGTFSSSNGGGTFAALCSLWGEYPVTHIRVGAGLWPSGGTVPYQAYVDDLILRTRWYTISFTGTDLFNYTASVADLFNQDAPRRLRDWTDDTPNFAYRSDGDANSNATNDFAEWALGSPGLAGYGFSYFNLWGATIAANYWDQPYHAVPDNDDGTFGVNSWRNQAVNGVAVIPGMGAPGHWEGGIVMANQSYNGTDHAFPVWRAPTDEQLTLANAASLRFSVDVLMENPESAFEPDGRLRVFFGGFNTLSDTGPAQEMSGIVLVPVNQLSLVPTAESIYITPGESILVDMDVAGLQQKVNACQAMLGYSSTFFADPTGQGGPDNYFAISPGGGVWDQVIWDSWKNSTGVPGEIDTAIGVNAEGAVGTSAPGTVCKIKLTSRTGVEGVTQMVFRADVPGNDTKQTFLSDMSAQAVWPSKLNSTNIYIDGTLPTITCPPNVIVGTDPDACSATGVALGTPTTGDALSGVASVTNDAPAVYPKGVTTVTWTVTDNAGNSNTCAQTVTVNDTEKPVIPDHADIAVGTDDGVCTAVVSWPAISASDNCDGTVAVTCVPASGSTFAKGETIVTMTATDAATNAAISKTFKVIVTDDQAPTAPTHADISVGTDSDKCGAVVTWDSFTTTDNCDDPITVVCVPASGTTFSTGTTTVNMTATDAASNSSTGSFTVTVTDDDPPVISSATPSETCVKNQNVTITATATDNCPGSTITWAHRVRGVLEGTGLTVLNSELDEGSNTLEVRASDGANTSAWYPAGTVSKDTTAPALAIVSIVPVNIGTGGCALQGDVIITATVSDGGCSGLEGFTLSNSSELGSFVFVSLTGNTIVHKVAITSATPNGSHTITATAFDGNNNSVSVTGTLCVNKNRISGTVTMPGFVGSSRDVAFYINGTVAGQLLAPLSFVGGVASYTLVDVPNSVSTLSAKTAWSLRQRLTFGLGGNGQATGKNFTLLGGDINNTNSVNVLDYSILKVKWLKTGAEGAAADINGNGSAGSDDYDIMKTNWFKSGDAQ